MLRVLLEHGNLALQLRHDSLRDGEQERILRSGVRLSFEVPSFHLWASDHAANRLDNVRTSFGSVTPVFEEPRPSKTLWETIEVINHSDSLSTKIAGEMPCQAAQKPWGAGQGCAGCP